jgi:hypothetical protein
VPTGALDLFFPMLEARICSSISLIMASGIDPEGIKIGVRMTFETGKTRDDRPKATNVRIA